MIAIKKQLVEQDDYVTNGLKRMRLPVDIIEREGVIGLRNLGATCYLNALLENWFYIESFRNGILSFSGTDLIIYELQKTFMFLKESKRSSYDPKTFIDSMGLGYSVQQDVQEFTKLLLLRLDSTFQQVTSLQDLVSSHFKGNLTYLTTCLNCKRVSSRQEEFLELEVSLSESLNESIHRLLYKELLTDSNKYACGNCGNLQDATREVQLESLPPILNIQFLRFVYDLKSFTKKKLKTKVKFTKTLDFNGIAQGDSEDLIYDLHAVLLHRGQSANSGHYVIRVYNEE
jgi:ubiquitin carboxyl-terminal hydrolase 48